jgi:secreted trypsin-like serine protease
LIDESGEAVIYACGGSLISEKFILTAGHCLYAGGPVKWVKLGLIHRDQDDDNVHTIEVEEIFQHPDYIPKGKNNDIGLLKLKESVPLSERIFPICLPQVSTIKPRAVATGFGRTGFQHNASDELLKVTLEKFENSECQEVFKNHVVVTNDTMLCFGHRTEARDTCNVS